ncbi:MAG: hypothetical protein LBP60_10005 [Spirochaetaceae bacterium]|jgi:hypothetical protein|nr:hypothetical protein [Spirochaetaceae bacterium]
MKKRFFYILFFLPFFAWAQAGTMEVFIPARPGPAIVPGSEELARAFRELRLGMDLEELKKALAGDGLFEFRGDRDVSFLPAKEENLVETTGLSFIRRAFFQLREGRVFIMAFSLDPSMIDHYSVFTSLIEKYGEPVLLNPREAIWENGETRISIERPLTVKYIDMTVFKAIMGEAKAEEAAEVFRRRGFLDEF